jgi:hypothetical protein
MERFVVRFEPEGHLSGWQIVDTATDSITHAYGNDAEEEACAREVSALMNRLPEDQQRVLWPIEAAD